MSFASLIFFLFLPTVFILHWLGRGRKWQNAVLLAASYTFYGWWDWRFCFLMLASSMIDYGAGLWLAHQNVPRLRKRILIAALSGNILILGFFKYYNFFTDSLVIAFAMVGIDLPASTLHIILPVGISFYTFQTMSYTLDIYWNRFQPHRNLLDYLAFVSFFPQLVAGPIERARNLLPQFQAAREFSPERAVEGCRLILWGLAKKMVVADNLGRIVEAAYTSPGSASSAALFLATVSFSFQIYFDFSAYSDIAIGTARLFGIQLMRNFAYPYFSQSITEFWRRWHISLSSWFRDYVYIPLGGNRVTELKQYRNLMLTALLSGLWHGAAWTFVIWGGLHGLYLIAERIFYREPKPPPSSDPPAGTRLLPRPGAMMRIVVTFALVCLAWIFFRAPSLGEAIVIVQKVVAGPFQPAFYMELSSLGYSHGAALLFLGIFMVVEWIQRHRFNPFAVHLLPRFARWTVYTVLFWSVLIFGTQRTQEFIYFRF